MTDPAPNRMLKVRLILATLLFPALAALFTSGCTQQIESPSQNDVEQELLLGP